MASPDTFDDPLVIAGTPYRSRLLLGTGKYRSATLAAEAIAAGGAEIVTLAIRRMALADAPERIVDTLGPERYTYLPNSAGCYSAEEAVRMLRLARAAGGFTMVKLEVIGDRRTLYPDEAETLAATRALVADGFTVLVYTTDNPALCRALEAAGAAAVMPLAAPIGSGQGILRPDRLREIIDAAGVPVIVDAGLGTPSDAAIAMEIGADAVLLNTAIAEAGDPVRMATAFRLAVEAGRLACQAGRMEKRHSASPSSPESDLFLPDSVCTDI